MREPRPRQRLPEGGLEIFEQRKAGTWKHPGLICAQPVNWKHPRPLEKPKTHEQILATGYIVLYQPHFDPMLYFWPVENFTVICHLPNIEDDYSKRLARAILRDGAEYVSLTNRTRLSCHSKMFHRDSGWKTPSAEWTYEVPRSALRRRHT